MLESTKVGEAIRSAGRRWLGSNSWRRTRSCLSASAVAFSASGKTSGIKASADLTSTATCVLEYL
jgi:hypothetical protein